MDGERWAELKSAFATLIDDDPTERARRLADLASTDPELSRRLDALLAADAQADALLGTRLPFSPAEDALASGEADFTTSEAAFANAEAGRQADASPSDGASAEPRDPFGLAGRTVSHFRVQDVLGVGGMGVLYRAEDTLLGRTVALKFLLPQYGLDASAKERFLNEARAVSALDHPNICTVHEVGETEDGRLFLAMACYAGETLRDRLASAPVPIEQALDIARQVLVGLGAAHAAGIVHRDLKPGNLMLTPEGAVKILDFGLAKIRDLNLTDPDLRPGTAAYMSPEQIDGNAVDGRTDLWSLGVVLYEMLTGRPPFGGGHDLGTVYAIMNDEPPPLSTLREGTPPELDRIARKLLDKRPEERYATAAEVLEELDVVGGAPPRRSAGARPAPRSPRPRAVALAALGLAVAGGLIGAALGLLGPAASAEPAGGSAAPDALGFASPAADPASLAVLPFLDLSPERDHAYFSDGMTEELIGHLSKIEGLRVSASTSSFRFRNRDTDVREVGDRLGVAHVLEGSVRRAGDRLRITAQLVSTENGYRLWSDIYERRVGDVFAVQEEIARAIAEALRLRLATPVGAPVDRLRVTSIEAYELYLRGRFFASRRTEEDLAKAAEYYGQAIAVDPGFARAHAGLAETYIATRRSAPGDRFRRGREAALRALAIDSTLAEAHTAMGWIAMWYDRDWSGAERHFQQALASDPHYLWAHQWYSAFLAAVGRLDEALAAMQRAHATDPLSVATLTHMGTELFWLGRLDEAVAQYRKALDLDPRFYMAHWGLSRAMLVMGRHEEAIRELEYEGTDYVGFFRPALLGHAYAVAGRTDEARQVLADLHARMERGEYVAPTELASVHLGLGELEQALDWLERHEADRGARIFLAVDPMFDPLRSHPRFVGLLERLGLT